MHYLVPSLNVGQRGKGMRIRESLTKKYSDMKRMYTDNTRQAAFENACDCMIYGYGRTVWNDCGLSDADAKEVWETAREYLGNNL